MIIFLQDNKWIFLLQEPVHESTVHEGINGKAIDDDHFFDEVADEAKKIANKERKKAEMSKKNNKKAKEVILNYKLHCVII